MSFRLVVIRIPTKWCTEKFFRKLAGMADLEDALNKLDRLTQEEVRIANAEVFRITQSIRDGVKVVGGKIKDIGDKVEGVGDKVEEVGDKVEDVGNKVEDVADQVKCVDDRVQVVIDGTRLRPGNRKCMLMPILSDGRQARVVAKDIGDMVQVVIDGARGLSSQRLKPSNTYTFRHSERKSSGTGIKIGHPTDCQRHRQGQVFVASQLPHYSHLTPELTRREPVNPASTILALSR